MIRRWRALAALILLASPLAAQVVNGRVSSPIVATPLIVTSLSAAAGAATIVAPSLTAAPLSMISAAPMAIAAPVAASALPALSAAADGIATQDRQAPIQAATPRDGWANRFNFQPEGRFFDGVRELKSNAGAVFAAVPKGQSAVRVHIVGRAPLAASKAVAGTEGLSGKALLDALNVISARGHAARGYIETSDYMFSTADQVVINGVKGVVDAYSGIFVPGTSKEGGDYPEPGDANGDGFPDKAGMNVEHTWPQSLFGKALPERSDIHHLMATFMHPNSVRGHLPFGVVTGRPDYENKAGAKRGNGVFEPPDEAKGLVARKQLYFYTRYKNSRMFGRASVAYWNQQIEILMQWNRQYPPDVQEMRRNDLSEKWQGNRNPFIDDYLLADRVGADAFRADGSRFAALEGPRPDRRGEHRGKHRRSVRRGGSPRFARR